jgi:hypothetical protein
MTVGARSVPAAFVIVNVLVIVVVLAALGGCGTDDGRTTTAGGPTTTQTPPAGAVGAGGGDSGKGAAAFGLRTCDDLTMLAADPDEYRAEPVYVGNDVPVEKVAEWARTQPGFEELWIDREHNGWISVAFSVDAAARQADIERLFPDDGVVAVPVDDTMAGLLDLQQRVISQLPAVDWGMASGVQPQHGVVTVGIGVLRADRLAAVAELFGDDPICVEGVDPATVVPEGPQPPGGDGWRLLLDEVGGPPYRTGIAADTNELDRLWTETGLPGRPPVVDFGSEVVIWFGAVFSGSCPAIRLDDVVVNHDASLVHAQIVSPGPPPAACTSDANGRTYLVAVPRDRLPAPPFRIQLGAQDPPPGATEERTVVTTDLR